MISQKLGAEGGGIDMPERLSKRERRVLARAERQSSLEVKLGLPLIPSWITIEGAEEIGYERVKLVVEAAQAWHLRFNFGRSLTIKPIEHEERVFEDGSAEITEEVADPGYISLGPEARPYQATLHAMTHASAPDQPLLFPEPITFRDGILRGWQGLTLLVTLASGEETRFSKFEEGMCERNASAFKGYTVQHRSYFSVGRLTRHHFPFDAERKAPQLVQRNNGDEFIRKVLRLSPNYRIGGEEIEHVMSMYMAAWNQGEFSQ